MHIGVLPTCVFVIPCVCPVLMEARSRGSPVVRDLYEPPCGCWGSNRSPLEEQPVLLLTEPCNSIFVKGVYGVGWEIQSTIFKSSLSLLLLYGARSFVSAAPRYCGITG